MDKKRETLDVKEPLAGERKVEMIESLLAKPTTKPDFTSMKDTAALNRVKMFMPDFVKETDRLLSDPSFVKGMDIKIRDLNDVDQEDDLEDNDLSPTTGSNPNNLLINMVSICIPRIIFCLCGL